MGSNNKRLSKKIFLISVILFSCCALFAGQNKKSDKENKSFRSLNKIKFIEPDEYTSFKIDGIGENIVYWKERKIGDITVEKNIKVYIFGKEEDEKFDKRIKWDSLPSALPKARITEKEARLTAGGKTGCARLLKISPESDVYKLLRTPAG